MDTRRRSASLATAFAAMGALAMSPPEARVVRLSEAKHLNIREVFGLRETPNWNGFAGFGRGRPTPSKRRHRNPKHAKSRARRARARR